jgi:hypothetical protein
MSHRSLWMFSLIVPLVALGTGCAQAPDSDGDEDGEAVSSAEEALATEDVDADLIQISAGKCMNDGVVIKQGKKYRLGSYIGVDVTGITDPNRSHNGPVCHNQQVWTKAANYVCNINTVGKHKGWVPLFQEWVDGVIVNHPGKSTTKGLFFGHADLGDLCDTPSQEDYVLESIECCMGQPKTTIGQ